MLLSLWCTLLDSGPIIALDWGVDLDTMAPVSFLDDAIPNRSNTTNLSSNFVMRESAFEFTESYDLRSTDTSTPSEPTVQRPEEGGVMDELTSETFFFLSFFKLSQIFLCLTGTTRTTNPNDGARRYFYSTTDRRVWPLNFFYYRKFTFVLLFSSFFSFPPLPPPPPPLRSAIRKRS
jgi:hypothetical protein